MMDKIKKGVRSWLNIEGASPEQVTIKEALNYETNVFRNRLWYRGDPAELQQFYQQINDGVSNTSFWSATSSKGVDFRKIHAGLPSLMVDTLTHIVLRDMNDITLSTVDVQKDWELISEDNNFKSLLETAIPKMLTEGDGAFKISFDPEISKYPIIEFHSGDDVQFDYRRGRIVATRFISKYLINKKTFILHEINSNKGIVYELYDKHGNEIALNSFDQFSHLKKVENSFEKQKINLSIPVFFGKSPKWEGRGRSIFDTKTGAFDSYDECWSQWIDAMRDGRIKTYIPEAMIPRNGQDGKLSSPNAFDDRFVIVGDNLAEESGNMIASIAPDIKHEALLSTYMTALDLCLQGIISPSTLGIDVKKLDNAEAQREKEKATLYTRNKIIEELQRALPKLIDMTIKVYKTLQGEEITDYETTVSFGEYANPSFEAVIETLGKAKMQGLMSNERIVEELYGDTWEPLEKEKEVERLNAIDGLNDFDPSTAIDDVDEGEDSEPF